MRQHRQGRRSIGNALVLLFVVPTIVLATVNRDAQQKEPTQNESVQMAAEGDFPDSVVNISTEDLAYVDAPIPTADLKIENNDNAFIVVPPETFTVSWSCSKDSNAELVSPLNEVLSIKGKWRVEITDDSLYPQTPDPKMYILRCSNQSGESRDTLFVLRSAPQSH